MFKQYIDVDKDVDVDVDIGMDDIDVTKGITDYLLQIEKW